MGHAQPQRLGKTRRARRMASSAGLRSVTPGGKGWGLKYRIAVDVPTFDPTAIVDQISDVVMAETWHAIGDGRKSDGSAPQPPLAEYGRAGRRAAEGQRPNVRGYTGLSSKPFRDELTREAIKVSGVTLRRSRVAEGTRALAGQAFLVVNEIEGTRAKTKIRPAKIHRKWLEFEAERGVAYLYTGGFMASLVDEAVAKIFTVSMKRMRVLGDKRERRAAEARTK